ncbi:hypothetical protein HDV01_005006 [Terramyces sp. JEL0728]|nr:hypothetical protein HDV01_005006 [Terramyces sp. JEL0728]
MLPIVLGSSSSFRAGLLKSRGLAFTQKSPDIDEKSIGVHHRKANKADLLVLEVARAKATALLETVKEHSILITCDQVVVCNGKIREKPVDELEARNYLESYADYPAETHSAIVVVNTASGKSASGVDVAKQYFHRIPSDVIAQAIKEGNVMKSAGGFLIDDPLFTPYLKSREGEEDSIIGLPLDLLERAGAIGLFHAQYLNHISNSVVLLKRKLVESSCTIKLTNLDGSIQESKCRIESAASKGDIETLLVCTKANDALSSIQQYIGRLSKDSNIILLTNGGLQVKNDLLEFLKAENVKTNIISGLTTHGVKRTGDYSALHTGQGETCLGILEAAAPAFATSILVHFAKALADIHFSTLEPSQVHERLLLKTLVNSCINPLTAILGCKNGGILNQWCMDVIHKTVEEIKCATPELDKYTVQELNSMVIKVAQNTFENTNSMLVDVSGGRQTEIDFLNGYFLKRHADMPVNNTLYQLVKAKEFLADGEP